MKSELDRCPSCKSVGFVESYTALSIGCKINSNYLNVLVISVTLSFALKLSFSQIAFIFLISLIPVISNFQRRNHCSGCGTYFNSLEVPKNTHTSESKKSA